MTAAERDERYRRESAALLREIGPPAPPPSQAELVASRDEPPDPSWSGAPPIVDACAEIELPLATGRGRVRVYRGGPPAPRPILLWLHGGGWVGGSLDDIDATCRALALAADSVVVSLDYRLAPEHPFPAALTDTGETIDWLIHHGAIFGGNGRVAVGGQSAGANLVAAAGLAARDRGRPLPHHQVLCYPSLSASCEGESYDLFDGALHDRAGLEWSLRQYLGAAEVTALVAPLTADSLAGLPPTTILAAGRDPLRDDARRFHARLLADGVASTYREYAGTMHAFLNFPGRLSAAHDAVQHIAADLRAGP